MTKLLYAVDNYGDEYECVIYSILTEWDDVMNTPSGAEPRQGRVRREADADADRGVVSLGDWRVAAALSSECVLLRVIIGALAISSSPHAKAHTPSIVAWQTLSVVRFPAGKTALFLQARPCSRCSRAHLGQHTT